MSSKPIIAVTRVLPDAGMKMLAEATDVDVRIWPGDLPPTREELSNLVDGASAVISLVTDTIDAELLDQHPSIRTVSNFAKIFRRLPPLLFTLRQLRRATRG
jgi:lactate dehydrogenase-like 2-hydroxyacid dehydrogenase